MPLKKYSIDHWKILSLPDLHLFFRSNIIFKGAKGMSRDISNVHYKGCYPGDKELSIFPNKERYL